MRHQTRKPRKQKSKTRKFRKSKTRKSRNLRGGAAAAVRPIETYRMTKDLKDMIKTTRRLMKTARQIDEGRLQDDIQYRVELEKSTILYVANKIASVLRHRALGAPGANYLNTPIINYLKMLYGNLISKYQMDRYGTLRGIKSKDEEVEALLARLEEEFNLEDGYNSNEGMMDDPEDLILENDDEILAMVNEFNQQP